MLNIVFKITSLITSPDRALLFALGVLLFLSFFLVKAGHLKDQNKEFSYPND